MGIFVKWDWSKNKGQDGSTPGFLRSNIMGENEGVNKKKGRDTPGYAQNLENWSQGMWEDLTGKTARTAGEEAAKQAEVARREAIIRQFGEKQQADGMVMANLKRGGDNKSAGTGATSGGFIGGGLSSMSGTF
jgi:hypothetical protein